MSLPTSMSSSLNAAVPWLGTGLSTGGAYLNQASQASALRYNASAYTAESGIASKQAIEQEGQQRITGAKVIGREVAAASESGGGMGGSTGRMIAQNARNAELDALNIRYKGALQRWSFGAQAQNLEHEAQATQTGAYLKAGAALLRGYSGNYTGNSPSQYYPTG